MRYATWSVQREKEVRKKLRLSQRILSAIMTPVMVFSMTGMNFSVAGLMTAHAEDAIVATDTVTTPASTPAPATVEAPKVDIPKVDPTPAPFIPKVETPAPASVVDPAPKAADPVVAPVTDPTPISAPAVDSTPAPDSDSTPAIVPATTVPTTPTVDAAGEATTERVIPEWVADGNKQTTGSSVVLGKKYVAPQNNQVTVTFTKLPENAGKLSIEEITLSDEQVASLHALSNKAYDITSDMADGTFAYTMTLPKPKDQKNVQIKFAENVAGLESASTVPSGDVKTKTDSVSATLNHFTVYTVTSLDHTITYTFDENVHLITDDGSAAIVSKDNIATTLHVYKYDSYAAYAGGAEPDKANGVDITVATFETGTGTGKVLSITYTGTLENNVKYVVDAWGYRIVNDAGVKVAAGSSDNQIILGDTVPPTTIADTVYDGSAKTITYTFSEPVRFKSEDTGAISAVDASKLAIYLYDAGSGNYGPDKVTGTNITNASFAGNVLTLTFTGNLVNQTDTSYIVDAFGYDIVDLAGNKLTRDSNQIFNVVGDTTAPTESSVVLDQTAKTVTTTFSEPVQLKNGSVITAYGAVTKNDLGIYKLTGSMTWENAAIGGVGVSDVHFSDATHLTVTYTGTLPTGTYIVDTFGADVTDLAGNKLTDAGARTFNATGVIDTPSIAGVTAPVTDATPTSTITATDLYTATISWSGAPVTFHPGTAYTATITITPKSGYTLTGVTSNYFTVADAIATNSANSGVISAVFPTTATKQLTIADPSSLTLSKTYDGTTTAAVTAGALSGVVSGDAVTVSAVATYNTKDFGTGKTITVEYTLSGNDAAKYIKPVNYTIATGIITQATSTTEVTCPTDSQTYTGSAITPCTVSVTGAGGLNLTPDPTYTSNTVVGTASASYTYAGDANHSGSGDSKNFDITAKHITGTFTASNKVYDGNDSATVTGRALVGAVVGDVVSLSGGTATFNNVNVADGKTVTLTGATLAGAAAVNYTLDSVATTTANITQASSTTTVTCPASATYTGSAITPCTVSVTGAGGLNLTPDPTYASNTVVGTASASYTYAGDANHSGSGDSKNFDITAKHITGTFTASNKVYDGNDSATVTGRALVGAVVGDVVSLSGGTATFNNVNVADGKTVTLTGATLAGAAAVNYTLDSVATTTANITQANLTITADDISKAYGDTDPTLTASYDGFVAGEDESVLDTPVTLTRDAGEAVGSYTITAHGAADANYNIAYVDGTFSIGQTTPDGDGNATLDNSNPQVVITDGSQAVTLEITNGTTDPSIDVSGLLGGGVSGTLPEITINAGVASVVIPDGTIVTGPAGWDGVIGGPAAGSSNGDSAPSGFAVGGTVISVGSPDKTLTFSVPVVITLPGVTGTVGYRPAGSTTWNEITNVCTGTYESPTGAPAGGECAISNGTDTKILTYHFTSFGNLLDTKAPDAVMSLKAKYGPKTDGKVEVTWHAKDSDISKTLVYRGETKHFTMNWDSRVAKQNKSDESYIDKNVEPGKTYYYKVVTEDAAGNQSSAEVIKIVIPTNGGVATGVLQATEAAPNDKGETVGAGTASDVSGTVSGATTGDQTVTDKGAAVLGADTQAGGFWGSVWMWIIVIGLGAGAVTIFMRRRPKGIA